jgi:hypothetical protein
MARSHSRARWELHGWTNSRVGGAENLQRLIQGNSNRGYETKIGFNWSGGGGLCGLQLLQLFEIDESEYFAFIYTDVSSHAVLYMEETRGETVFARANTRSKRGSLSMAMAMALLLQSESGPTCRRSSCAFHEPIIY